MQTQKDEKDLHAKGGQQAHPAVMVNLHTRYKGKKYNHSRLRLEAKKH